MQVFMIQEANYVSYLCIVHVRAVEEKIDSLVCREEGHRLEKLQAPPMRNESISLKFAGAGHGRDKVFFSGEICQGRRRLVVFPRDRLVLLSYKIEGVSLDLPYILWMRLKELYSPYLP